MQQINRLGALFILLMAVLFPAIARAGNAFEVPTNFPTIQRAVDFAPLGAVIVVASGNYAEDVVIAAGKQYTILSEDSNDPSIVKSFTVGIGAKIHFTNLILGGPGPAYPVYSLTAGKNAEITTEACVTRSAFRFVQCAKVDIAGAQMPGRLSVDTIFCERVAHVVISGSTISGGKGYAGQCSGTIAALPQDGNAAIFLRACGDVTLRDCVLHGGDGGELTSGDNCQAHLPIIAMGGSAVEEEFASIVFARNVVITGATGNPPGAAVALRDGSQYYDDSACGWQLR